MARIGENAFRQYVDGQDRLTAQEYTRERELLRQAINDTQEQLEAVGLENIREIGNNISNLTTQIAQVVTETQELNEETSTRLQDVQSTVEDLRVNGTGIDAQARQAQAVIQEKVSDIMGIRPNLVKNTDFTVTPFIQSRSSIYKFTPAIKDPSYNGRNSLKIEVDGYETSTDTSKDFSFILTENMFSNEDLKISFWAYPSVPNERVNIRLAYGSGVSVPLGEAEKWNKVEVQIDLSNVTKANNFLYFTFFRSMTLYMSDLRVESIPNITVEQNVTSFSQINDQLSEHPLAIHNSRGIIERLLDNTYTYYENVSNFVYGNMYTAYDPTQDLVNGKYQIDCSSFANLVIHGIPYNNSKYAGVTNKGSGLFFQNIDGDKYRYANQIAKYAYEKGYTFKPNSDLSNIEPGDVLFFSWKSFDDKGTGDLSGMLRENAFMKIDHVAVFLHKKNDKLWATAQFDNGISTVYYDASNTYMSQCVLVARFPYANVESLYTDDNLVIEGDIQKTAVNIPTIGSYKLTKPFKKGRYYSFVFEGVLTTENCYYILQVNGKNVYSDNGKQGTYSGVTTFRFPYLLDDIADTITVAIGAPSGTPPERNGNVKWCTLYEGYVRNKRQYTDSLKYATLKDFPLNADLVADMNSGFAPYYKYAVDANKIFINFSLPFNTLRTGSLPIGTLNGADRPITTQRLPINLQGANGEAVNGILQFSFNGVVSIVPYSNTVQWRYGLANGMILRN